MELQLNAGMSAKIQTWSQRLFIAALFLFPWVAVPLSWFPFVLLKVSLFSVLLLVSIVLAAVGSYLRGGFSLPKGFLLYAVLALPIVYAISALFSQNTSLSFIGDGTDTNTLFFAAFCAVIVIGGSIVLSTKRSAVAALLALVASLAVAAVFQVLEVTLGPGLFGMSVFSALSSNLIGKWNDFGVLMGLVAVFAMVALDVMHLRMRLRVGAAALLALSLGFVALVGLDSAWQALALLAVCSGLATLFGMEGLSDPMMPRKRNVPYAAIIVLVIAVTGIAWGSQISATLIRVIPVSELEVRPSIGTTFDILKSTYGQSVQTTLVGTGPGTFIEQWLMYKPATVNTTQFWNLDFAGGSGVIPTAFITTGILGALTWVALLLLLVWFVLRSVVRPHSDPGLYAITMAASLGALYLFAASFMYLTGEIPLLIAFSLLAIALATHKLGLAHERVLLLRDTRFMARAVSMGTLAVVLITSAGVAYIASQRFAASLYVGRALATQADDSTVALGYATKASQVYANDATFRLLSTMKLSQAQAISNEDPKKSTDQPNRFQSAFADSVKYAQQAIAANPRNYQNYALTGQLFEALMPLKVSGAYDSAKQYYIEAIKRNPSNPGLFLSAARMEAQAGNEESFRQAIQSALSLKPNFTEAALLVVQFEVARNNIDGAIIAAQVAAQTAPQNPGIFFQLGLLKYAKGDADGARSAFELALKLQPDYANAKYFLGLTYQKLSRTQEAIALFEDLKKGNPGNAEVALILNNMKAGKDPFANSAPPVTPNPETRDTPPIKE